MRFRQHLKYHLEQHMRKETLGEKESSLKLGGKEKETQNEKLISSAKTTVKKEIYGNKSKPPEISETFECRAAESNPAASEHSRPAEPEKAETNQKRSRAKSNRKTSYPCRQCGQKLGSRHGFYYHKKRHLGLTDHICDLCGKGFITAAALKGHLRIHTGEKPYECHICLFRMQYREQLRNHWNRHKMNGTWVEKEIKQTGEAKEKIRFPCGQCGKQLSTRVALKNHEKRHLGIKDHICKVCGRGFVEAPELVEHLRVHTGEKPYECHICSHGGRFRVRRNLKKHLNVYKKNGTWREKDESSFQSCNTTSVIVKCSADGTISKNMSFNERPATTAIAKSQDNTIPETSRSSPKSPPIFAKKSTPRDTAENVDSRASNNESSSDESSEHPRPAESEKAEANDKAQKRSSDESSLQACRTTSVIVKCSAEGTITKNGSFNERPATSNAIAKFQDETIPVNLFISPSKSPLIFAKKSKPPEIAENFDSGASDNESSYDLSSKHSIHAEPEKAETKNKVQNRSSDERSGQIGFPCDQCEKSFSGSSALTNHKKMHLGLKEHICLFCKRGFTEAPALVDHMRSHTKEKPKCHVCSKRLRYRQVLKTHLNRHKKNGTWVKKHESSLQSCNTNDKTLMSSTDERKTQVSNARSNGNNNQPKTNTTKDEGFKITPETTAKPESQKDVTISENSRSPSKSPLIFAKKSKPPIILENSDSSNDESNAASEPSMAVQPEKGEEKMKAKKRSVEDLLHKEGTVSKKEKSSELPPGVSTSNIETTSSALAFECHKKREKLKHVSGERTEDNPDEQTTPRVTRSMKHQLSANSALVSESSRKRAKLRQFYRRRNEDKTDDEQTTSRITRSMRRCNSLNSGCMT